jgi:hypothetical protein
MINLIPPAEKKKMVREYWVRVISVWFYIWTCALIMCGLLMIPTYVLIHSQVAVYAESAKVASENVATFEEVTKSLRETNEQAAKLQTGFKQAHVSDWIKSIRALEYPGIELTEITISQTDGVYEPIKLVGIASDRQALAAFRDRLLGESEVATVNLPLGNLAKDKDISFDLTVILKKKTP